MGQETYGRSPVGPDGKAQGPYAHLSGEPGTFGMSAGFGLMDGPIGDGANASVLSANMGLGKWVDPRTGKTNYGVNADAQLVKMSMDPGGALGPVGFDVGVLDASAGAYHNDTTTGIGAQANIIDGAVSLGNQEHSVRGGLSLGVGLAGRAHHGDADGDGIPELGFGFDFGPVSFDMKSELLGRAWNGLSDAGSWVASHLPSFSLPSLPSLW